MSTVLNWYVRGKIVLYNNSGHYIRLRYKRGCSARKMKETLDELMKMEDNPDSTATMTFKGSKQ